MSHDRDGPINRIPSFRDLLQVFNAKLTKQSFLYLHSVRFRMALYLTSLGRLGCSGFRQRPYPTPFRQLSHLCQRLVGS